MKRGDILHPPDKRVWAWEEQVEKGEELGIVTRLLFHDGKTKERE